MRGVKSLRATLNSPILFSFINPVFYYVPINYKVFGGKGQAFRGERANSLPLSLVFLPFPTIDMDTSYGWGQKFFPSSTRLSVYSPHPWIHIEVSHLFTYLLIYLFIYLFIHSFCLICYMSVAIF